METAKKEIQTTEEQIMLMLEAIGVKARKIKTDDILHANNLLATLWRERRKLPITPPYYGF